MLWVWLGSSWVYVAHTGKVLVVVDRVTYFILYQWLSLLRWSLIQPQRVSLLRWSLILYRLLSLLLVIILIRDQLCGCDTTLFVGGIRVAMRPYLWCRVNTIFCQYLVKKCYILYEAIYVCL